MAPVAKSVADPAGSDAIMPTESEMRCILAILKHGPRPNPDWDKVGAELNTSNAAARTRWSRIIKKFEITFANNGNSSAEASTKKTTAKKRKAESISTSDAAVKAPTDEAIKPSAEESITTARDEDIQPSSVKGKGKGKQSAKGKNNPPSRSSYKYKTDLPFLL
jgi:hypothetical protein